MPDDLSRQAAALAQELFRTRRRVVFAESCTGGLIAAALARTPGIAEHLCGSAVTYREATKTQWLGVPAREMARHTAVSEQVARRMALGVLANTPEADYSAAVTGHLGPNAPESQDGLVFVAVAHRLGKRTSVLRVERVQLVQRTRLRRQREAAALVLSVLRGAIVEQE
jgi:PncC family amidohydrolase